MTNNPLAEIYVKRKTEFENSLTSVRKKINRISNLRILIALLVILFIYVGFYYSSFFWGIPFLITFFLFLVQSHGKAFDEKVHLENLVRINNNELELLKGNFNVQYPGSEFSDPHHPYSHDLDIFGDSSLFQYANRCNTLEGRRKFSECLTVPLSSEDEIVGQQEAVQELTALLDFRQHVQAGGMEIKELPDDLQQLKQWLKQPSFLYGKKIYAALLIVVPPLTVGFVITAFFVSGLKPVAIALALFQWAFLGFHIKKVNAFHEYISRKKNVLEKYGNLLLLLDKNSFKSYKLQQLNVNAHQAGAAIKKLSSLVNALDARMNFMMNLLVNSLLMYDLQCVYRLEKWKATHAGQLEQWLEAIAETEVLCSWGTFAYNNPAFTYPKIENRLSVAADALGHPLIQHDCVVNDVVIGDQQRIQIITGANMAGKSTFLRSIGVNLVLALAGAPVYAKNFHCPIIHLRTGMRTADSLKDHQSYFYAELNRLKSIMDELQQDKPLLILLDEILKGTNSTDKLSGSIQLVTQLLPHPCLALIATHDLALGKLETSHPQAIRNFCFEATIENDQLSFDYKLKRGLAQKMNATFLMKKMGIIPG
jgi:DNA mismatch repair ATPase MutS